MLGSLLCWPPVAPVGCVSPPMAAAGLRAWGGHELGGSGLQGGSCGGVMPYPGPLVWGCSCSGSSGSVLVQDPPPKQPQKGGTRDSVLSASGATSFGGVPPARLRMPRDGNKDRDRAGTGMLWLLCSLLLLAWPVLGSVRGDPVPSPYPSRPPRVHAGLSLSRPCGHCLGSAEEEGPTPRE